MKKFIVIFIVAIFMVNIVSEKDVSAVTYKITKQDIDAFKKGKFTYGTGVIGMTNESLAKKKGVKSTLPMDDYAYYERPQKRWDVLYFSRSKSKVSKVRVIQVHYRGSVDYTQISKELKRDKKSDLKIKGKTYIKAYQLGKKRVGVRDIAGEVTLYLAQNTTEFQYFNKITTIAK